MRDENVFCLSFFLCLSVCSCLLFLFRFFIISLVSVRILINVSVAINRFGLVLVSRIDFCLCANLIGVTILLRHGLVPVHKAVSKITHGVWPCTLCLGPFCKN